MIDEAFEQRVRRVWAAHFGCPVDDLARGGTTVVPRERLTRTGALHIVHVGARAFAEIDPRLVDETISLLDRLGHDTRLTARVLGDGWGGDRLALADAGLVFHLHPDDLVRRQPPSGLTLKFLKAEDQPPLDELNEHCAPEEVNDAYVHAGDEIAFACLDGTRAVSAGSGYRRNGFMDMGVITHPGYRGRRLAPAVLAALSEASQERGWIPQYRCDQTNGASRRVAETTGYTLFFTTETVQLKA